jgi:hypothetical protein
MEFAFHTRSWTRVEGMSLDALQAGFQKVFARLIELGLAERMPTQEQRDRLAEVLTTHNIRGEERIQIEGVFAAFKTSSEYEAEIERTAADLAMRLGAKEPQGTQTTIA